MIMLLRDDFKIASKESPMLLDLISSEKEIELPCPAVPTAKPSLCTLGSGICTAEDSESDGMTTAPVLMDLRSDCREGKGGVGPAVSLLVPASSDELDCDLSLDGSGKVLESCA